MKNKDVNKNVIKAITIGLAAAMALMPNATVFAADGEGEDSGSKSEQSSESSESESSSEESSSATESVSEAAEACSDAAESFSSDSSGGESFSDTSYDAPSSDSFSEPSGDSFSEPSAPSFSEPSAETPAPAEAAVPGGMEDSAAQLPEAAMPGAAVLPGAEALPGAAVLPGAEALPGAAVLPGAEAMPGAAVLPGQPAADQNLLLQAAGLGGGDMQGTATAGLTPEQLAAQQFNTAAAALTGLSQDLSALDQANAQVGLMGQYLDDQQYVAGLSTDFAAARTQEASQAASEAREKAEEASQTASDKKESLKAAPGAAEGTEQAPEAGSAGASGTEQAPEAASDAADSDATDEAKEASKAASDAKEKAEAASEAASEALGSATEAAGAIYENAEQAAEAQKAAAEAAEQVQLSLEECEKATKEAQDKLDTAGRALDAAQIAVDSARAAKEKADEAEADAKNKLIDILQENGIDYEESGDGIIITDDMNPEDLDGPIRKALDAAQKALEEAQANAGKAEQDYLTKNTETVNAANALVDAAKEKLDAANQELGSKTDAELESLLETVKERQNDVKNIVQNKGSLDEYKNANLELTVAIAQYMLAQEDPSIDRQSFKVTRLNDGTIKLGNSSKYLELAYQKDGKTCYAYFNYEAYYKDGDRVGTKNRTDLVDADHIYVMRKIPTKWNTSGTGAAFGNGEVFFSELALNNGQDGYQSDKAETENRIAEAQAELDAANKALAAYMDPEAAANALKEAQDNLAAAQDRMNQYSEAEVNTLEGMIETIKDQQKAVGQTTGMSDYWQANRALTKSIIKYSLLQQGNVDPDSIRYEVEWNNKNGTSQHFCKVTYRLKDTGETQSGYFDYIAYYEDGETVGQGTGGLNDFQKNLNKGNRPHHIVVVQKTLGENGDFIGKGEAFFNELDFTNGKDAYQSAKNQLITLGEAVESAQGALDTADSIRTLKEKAETAKELSEKANTAKQKVVDATIELGKAKADKTATKDLIETLEANLEQAKKEYKQADEDLKAANDKVSEIREYLQELKDITGFEISVPEEPSSPESGGEKKAEDTDTDTGKTETGADKSGGSSSGGSGGGASGSTSSGGSGGGASGGTSSGGSGGGASGGASSGGSGAGIAAAAASGGSGAAFGEAGIPGVFQTVADGASDLLQAAAGGAADLLQPGAGGAAGADTAGAPEAVRAGGEDDLVEAGVLGARVARVRKMLGDVLSTRREALNDLKLMKQEDGIQVSILWWVAALLLGAKGIDSIKKRRKSVRVKGEKEGQRR